MSAAAAPAPGHIHLPSVHIRFAETTGFDYEEDIYIRGRGRSRRFERVVRLVILENGEPTSIRETFDELCPEELAELQAELPVLMDEKHSDVAALMEQRAGNEFARQRRITAGQEQVCHRCGCSETRGCSGGCLWATERLCSRCV